MTTPEPHAEAILRAAGSSLANYTMPGTRQAILDAVREAMGSGWQPIETAPRDGTWIIAWDGKGVQPMIWEVGDEDYPKDYRGWCYADHRWGGTLYDGCNEVLTHPTHWMPLPPPPPPKA